MDNNIPYPKVVGKVILKIQIKKGKNEDLFTKENI